MSAAPERCLVLTLHSGENEFERACESLRSQTFTDWEQRVFSNLPNKQAHDRLYSEVMNGTGEFSWFVKLDADMVFTGPEVLASMIGMFRSDPGLDHAMFELRDFMTDGPLMGLHVYSNRARWSRTGDNLFVDPDPEIPGRRRMVRQAPAPVAFHAPDPSPYQAFHFGVHRALKAFQPGRTRANHDQARKQWALLTRVWEHFSRNPDPRLGLAVLGADLVWTGRIGVGGSEFDDSKTRERFEENRARSAEELHRMLRGRWQAGWRRTARWARTGGLKVGRGLLRSRLGRRRGDPGARS